MKYGLLVTSPVAPTKNIGDYIQSLAARQYSENYSCLVEKEDLCHFQSDEKVKVIMNGWYMIRPENWPPSDSIVPLLTSIHISPLYASRMLYKEGVEYMKKYGPVGCRDLGTKNLLDKAGVPSYFSGCLTLTLGRKYKYEEERSGVVFVDPYIPPFRYQVEGRNVYYWKNIFKACWYYLTNKPDIDKLYSIGGQMFESSQNWARKLRASLFYHYYSKVFGKDVLKNAEYVTHAVPVKENDNNESLLSQAECLLNKYMKAKLVVTTRIHCALPCLGLDTPVIFVWNEDLASKSIKLNAPGRLDGLRDLFRIMTFSSNRLTTEDEEIKKMLKSKENLTFKNKNTWKQYAESLVKKCEDFINEE